MGTRCGGCQGGVFLGGFTGLVGVEGDAGRAALNLLTLGHEPFVMPLGQVPASRPTQILDELVGLLQETFHDDDLEVDEVPLATSLIVFVWEA